MVSWIIRNLEGRSRGFLPYGLLLLEDSTEMIFFVLQSQFENSYYQAGLQSHESPQFSDVKLLVLLHPDPRVSSDYLLIVSADP